LLKAIFSIKIDKGRAGGAPQEFWDPLFISADVESHDLKFGTQSKTTFRIKIDRGLG